MSIPILLIDDDDLLRDSLSRVLHAQFDAEVLTADNGQRGLALLNQRSDIALIIVDIFMPQMDGLEFIRSIRQLGLDVKILAISGGSPHLSHDFLAHAKALGATNALHKPFAVELFAGTVKKMLRNGEKEV